MIRVGVRTVTPLVPARAPSPLVRWVQPPRRRPVPALHHTDEERRRATVSSEPEDLGPTGPGPLDAQRTPAGLPDGTSGSAAARSWTWSLVRSLVLLDSWSPESHRLSSPQAARRHLRAEWTRSGDLTEAQAAALAALDETTAWKA